MKKPSFALKYLPWGLLLLYTPLNELRHEAPGIWPLCKLNEEEYHDFFLKLQDLARRSAVPDSRYGKHSRYSR